MNEKSITKIKKNCSDDVIAMLSGSSESVLGDSRFITETLQNKVKLYSLKDKEFVRQRDTIELHYGKLRTLLLEHDLYYILKFRISQPLLAFTVTVYLKYVPHLFKCNTKSQL